MEFKAIVSDLAPYIVILSSSHRVDSNNCAMVMANGVPYSCSILYSPDVPIDSVVINRNMTTQNTNVSIIPGPIDPAAIISNIPLNPKYKFALMGLPVIPNTYIPFYFHGKLKSIRVSSQEPGFITSQTNFQKYQKIDINTLDSIPFDKQISDRICKLIQHRNTISIKSVLVIGGQGAGKTTLIKAILNHVTQTVELNLLHFLAQLESNDQSYIDQVFSIQDGVILIDDIDVLTDDAQASSILASHMFEILTKPIIVIASSRLQPASLPMTLQPLFSCSVSFGRYSVEERREILTSQFGDGIDIDFVMRETSGMTRGEFGSVLRLIPSLNPFTRDGFIQLLHVTATDEKPMRLRQQKEKAVGYKEVLDEMKLIANTTLFANEDTASLLQYSGILLHGRSGNGKSLLVQALSEEIDAPFFLLEFDKIFSRFLGESEKGVRDIFASARFFSPSVLVIEDIDAIGGKRSDESGVGGRVLSTLLNEIDGINKKSKVLLIATTNQPKLVDSALMRPGRFDRLIEVGNPSTKDRVAIFESYRKKTPVAAAVTNDQLAIMTNDFTCAEIQSFFRYSALQALKEEKAEVTIEYFQQGLKRVLERKQTQVNMKKL